MEDRVYICPECGGDNLIAESYARWSREKNAFVHEELRDDGIDCCGDCDFTGLGMRIPGAVFDMLHGEGWYNLEKLLDYLTNSEADYATTSCRLGSDELHCLMNLIMSAIRKSGEVLGISDYVEEEITLARTVADL